MASLSNAVSSGDLIDLISTSASTTVYPSDDAILAVLNTRFRSDNPYTRISTSNIVVVNPYKTLANINEVSAKDYEERCYRDTSVPFPGGPALPSPHLYELAAKVYLVMRCRNQSQSVIFRCGHPVVFGWLCISFWLTHRMHKGDNRLWKELQQHPPCKSTPQILHPLQTGDENRRSDPRTWPPPRIVRQRQNYHKPQRFSSRTLPTTLFQQSRPHCCCKNSHLRP